MGALLIGIWELPVDSGLRGYLVMGTLFLTAGTLALSKSLRDRHEDDRLVNRVKTARTEQVLSPYEG